VIVTFNVKDFPENALAEFGVEAQHPDDFIEYLFDLDQAAVVTAVKSQRENLRNPPVDIDQLLDILQKLGLPQTVNSLKPFRNVM